MEPNINYFQVLFSFLLVVGLIGIMGWAFKRFGAPEKWLAKARPDARLAVVENLPLDSRHKLILIRRDDTEHLLLIGSESATVVESNIPSAKGYSV